MTTNAQGYLHKRKLAEAELHFSNVKLACVWLSDAQFGQWVIYSVLVETQLASQGTYILPDRSKCAAQAEIYGMKPLILNYMFFVEFMLYIDV